MVSAEMPVLEIAKREAASASGINSLRINEGKLSADEWAKLTRAAGEMVNRQSDRLVMADKLGTDIEKIIHAMRQRRRQGRLDVLLIDYVQKLYARRLVGKGANRNTELEVVGNMLADFARETGVAVVIASQLKRGQGEPSMDSLRDSGALEAAADVIALIHREDEETEERDIIIAKNRQGPTSRMYTVLKPERMQFYEIQKSDGGQA
jgi:replicative DNA helicase